MILYWDLKGGIVSPFCFYGGTLHQKYINQQRWHIGLHSSNLDLIWEWLASRIQTHLHDAFVITKSSIPTLIEENSVFNVDELLEIAASVNKKIAQLAKH